MTPNLPIVSSRLFPVSPEELYAAFADPDRLALWWGPKDFRNTIRAFILNANEENFDRLAAHLQPHPSQP
jgi:uncharacterized protein YndB with AHSA1/START domain